MKLVASLVTALSLLTSGVPLLKQEARLPLMLPGLPQFKVRRRSE